MTEEEKREYNQGIIKGALQYCYCRSLGSQDIDDFYIGCDGTKECPNGGWYHWKCVPELKGKSSEELDKIEKWICPECREIEMQELSNLQM